ncbi:hypothetical protein [Halobacterium zhouii]|nr:hypothetical protein [Halobacterium zhouii]
MEFVSALKRRVGTDPPSKYECSLCAMQFEQRPGNCPACGSIHIRER